MNAISTLYLFSSLYPMTVPNILGAMSICSEITAFLSVPYILKMLAESSDGMQMLRGMDLVSTGGAPLPEARGFNVLFTVVASKSHCCNRTVGDDMVQRDVRLVSRLGSSECGCKHCTILLPKDTF
jgi:hypothetical protein